jgi:hypothetical protein
MVLLGTGWIIGVFMTIPEPKTQIALQYVFILLNSSQVSNSLKSPISLINEITVSFCLIGSKWLASNFGQYSA